MTTLAPASAWGAAVSGYPAYYGNLGAKGAWRMRWRYTEQLGLLRTAELSENDGVQELVTNL